MAYILIKVGQSFNVPVHTYEADTEEDMNSIDIQGVPIGSKCHIINDGKWYMLNSDGKWKAMPKQVQPDWNQNDDTAADYIKNRPFYTGDPVETVLVEESTVSFTDIGGLYTGVIESTFSPTVGNAYKISWDGTDYESTCVKVGRDACIGNLSIDGSGPDTGEPFLMQVTNQEIDVATLNQDSYHTISISGFVPGVVVKIDKKYLPDNPFNITGATVGQIAKITAVDDSGKPTAWEAVDLPSGGGGDIALGITGASVGQIAKITAVDDSGKPTAWEAVDLPSGGGGDIALGITGASVGQIAKITAVDDTGKPTEWQAVTPETWNFVMADGTTVTKKVYADANE